ncbi:MAG: hypothetical protein NVS1B6_03790 [Steroidobacteraceae bacterium]
MTQDRAPLNRFTTTALAPLVDVGLFCVLTGNGWTLRSSHIASYIVAMTLNYLLKVRPVVIAHGRTLDSWLHLRLLAVSVLVFFLRGGVLAALSLQWGWRVQVAIVAAVMLGWAATALGYSQALSSVDAGARTASLAIGVIVYACLLRLVYMGSVELLPEEAYYWNYSRHLDFGYLDHPPLVAWLIRLGTAAFGQSPFGVRAGALCCGLVTSVFTYRLTRNLCGEASALAAVLLAQALPFFFVAGFLMTPDAPLTAAWSASLYYLERALLAERRSAWWGVGFAVGMGAISKYSIGLIAIVALAFILWDRQSRRWLLRWEPYGAALLALAIFSPVIVWNAQHEWASFLFQTSRRLAEAPRFSFHKLIASASVLMTPTGVLAVAAALSDRAAARCDSDAQPKRPMAGDDGGGRRRRLFIRVAVLLPLCVFALFSLRHEVKLDWTGAPWSAALPLLAAQMTATGRTSSGLRAWIRAAWMPTLVTMLLIYGTGLHYLVWGLPGLGYSKRIELLPVGWRDFGAQIGQNAAAIRALSGHDPLVVGMDRYAIASELAFYGADHNPSEVATSSSHLFGGIGLMYERWTPAEAQEGRILLLVTWNPGELSDKSIELHADRLGPVESGVLTLHGREVRRYYYRVLYNYRATPREYSR